MDIKKYVNDINAAHDVVVWSKTSCPYCTQVKNLYTQEGVKFNAIELDTVTNGSSIQQILQEISGIRTVPNIFIKGKHLPEISDDTFAAHGKLKQMLVANTTSINATETVVTVATTTVSPLIMEVDEQYVKSTNQIHSVVVWSKSYCPWCTKVKELFTKLQIKFFVVELDLLDGSTKIQKALQTISNQTTFPNVFIKGTHLGGCDKTLASHADGSLENMLGAVVPSAPLGAESYEQYVKLTNQTLDVVVWSETTCRFCKKVKDLFATLDVKFQAIELNTLEETLASGICQALQKISKQKTVPNVFIKGQHLGGCDDTHRKLKQMIMGSTTISTSSTTATTSTTIGTSTTISTSSTTATTSTTIGIYDYDLFVIGGGSGGLACAKEAMKLGKKVGVADFIIPSPTYPHTTWGLGGTCVNVGCIPKKLMHTAGLIGETMDDARHYGWKGGVEKQHSWKDLVAGVQKHITNLNKSYETDLKAKKIDYFNLYASFQNKDNNHEIYLTDRKKENPKVLKKTARRIVIAIGGRPRLPNIPGAEECCITSDDIFALKENPGENVLVIGASYVALECAGFLTSLGHKVTVMVRSILLRGFDQEMAEKIGQYMVKQGTKFLRGKTPTKMKKVDDKFEVYYKNTKASTPDDAKEESGHFDTVLCAIGRVPCTEGLGLDCAGVEQNTKLKIPVFQEQTNIAHIYAIGDVAAVSGMPDSLELTPVAIQAGKLLCRRLFGSSTMQMDYSLVPTTIFTPLEYGCIGMTEEDARKKIGEDNVEVYHQIFQPLEMTLPGRMNNDKEDHCFTKLVLDKSKNGKIIGFHYLGPNAAEVTQGFGLGMKLGANKEQIDNLVGIHPSNAENLTTLTITKNSGKAAVKEDC